MFVVLRLGSWVTCSCPPRKGLPTNSCRATREASVSFVAVSTSQEPDTDMRVAAIASSRTEPRARLTTFFVTLPCRRPVPNCHHGESGGSWCEDDTRQLIDAIPRKLSPDRSGRRLIKRQNFRVVHTLNGAQANQQKHSWTSFSREPVIS